MNASAQNVSAKSQAKQNMQESQTMPPQLRAARLGKQRIVKTIILTVTLLFLFVPLVSMFLFTIRHPLSGKWSFDPWIAIFTGDGSALGAHVIGAQNRLAAQIAYVLLCRDVAAAAHIDQAVAVIEDGKRCGFAVHTIELTQRLRAHQKANATAAHGRNTPLKIGNAAHVGKLIKNKLHVVLQMPAGVGISAALGQVKQLLKGNVRKPCIGRVVVAHLKIDYALALVDTVDASRLSQRRA